MPMMRFQCPECGMGDYEVGHLVAEPVEYLRRLPGRAWPPDPPGVLAGAASSPLARLARRRLSGRSALRRRRFGPFLLRLPRHILARRLP